MKKLHYIILLILVINISNVFAGLVGINHNITIPGNTDTLPASWATVFGEQVKDDNHIRWSIANENNNDYYAVEISEDGKNFNEIGRVKSSGNSAELQHYSFIHNHGEESIYFYRIKQVNYIGNANYSKVITISQTPSSIINKVTLYPNPMNDVSGLSVTLEENSNVTISVNDIYGKIVYTKNANLTQGNNLLSINIGNCPAGAYFMKIRNDSGVNHTTKFIKN